MAHSNSSGMYTWRSSLFNSYSRIAGPKRWKDVTRMFQCKELWLSCCEVLFWKRKRWRVLKLFLFVRLFFFCGQFWSFLVCRNWYEDLLRLNSTLWNVYHCIIVIEDILAWRPKRWIDMTKCFSAKGIFLSFFLIFVSQLWSVFGLFNFERICMRIFWDSGL